VTRYPHYRVVNLDKLDYCSSLHNLDPVAGAHNYSFVKARTHNAGRGRGVGG
jgi:UDP-glucose 4,6-dehydratase